MFLFFFALPLLWRRREGRPAPANRDRRFVPSLTPLDHQYSRAMGLFAPLRQRANKRSSAGLASPPWRQYDQSR